MWNLGGLLGMPNSGLLSSGDASYLQNQGLLNLGAQLLAASGPSTTPTSTGQALGRGLLGFQQGQQQAMQGLLQNKLIGSKIQEAELEKQRQAKLTDLLGAPGALVPNDAQGDEMVHQPGTGLLGGQMSPQQFHAGVAGLGGDYGKYGLKAMLPDPSTTPSAIREWEYFSKLSKEQQAQYLGMKRQMYGVNEIGGVPTLVPRAPGIPLQPLSTLQNEATGKGTIAGATKAATVKAEAQADAQVNLGSTLDELQKMRTNVNGLLESPGFDTIYGLSGKIDPRNYVPGTDASNSLARREQLDAMSFGVSVQKMRGLGALSDAEGKKVSAAYTRATNPKLSAAEAREAWSEVNGYLELAERRMREKAGTQNTESPKTTKRVRVDAQGKVIP